MDLEIHHYGLAGREPLLIMLAASLLTLAVTRTYTRLARAHGWRSGRLGDVHVHHLVVGIVLALVAGMLEIALQPGRAGREFFALIFGVGAAFILDEFALSVHLRDVYWTAEGRHSIEVSIMWVLLGALLLVGISPFGIHDSSEGPRIVGFAVVAVSIVLSVVTCLKGKLTLGRLSIFVPPLGLVAALRLARPGSVWASVFYRRDPRKQQRARERFDAEHSFVERLRHRLSDVLGGAHDVPFVRGADTQVASDRGS
jgi:hypothetical protein